MAASQVQPNRFVSAEEHADVSYCKDPQIGPILSTALADLYECQPGNPLHFLGNWLLNYHSAAQGKEVLESSFDEKKELEKRYAESVEALKQVHQEKQAAVELKEKFESDFLSMLQASDDLEDNLSGLADHIHTRLWVSGVYIGKIERVKKPITLEDSDKAHIDPTAPEVIRYIASSKGHEFMVDKILEEKQGPLTYSVWKEPELDPVDMQEDEAPVEKEEGEERLNTKFVPNVIKEKSTFYFDVPKMGCFFAIPLNYQSCMFESAFDAGVDDKNDVARRRQEQEEQKMQSEAQSSHHEAAQDEEEEQEEEKVWEEINEQPYKTTQNRLVVCIDTLRQDRKLTEEEQLYAEKLIIAYSKEWEQCDDRNLRTDIEKYCDRKKKDKEQSEEKKIHWEEEESEALEKMAQENDLGAMSEEEKSIEHQRTMLKVYKLRLQRKYFKEGLLEFTELKTVKHAKVFQLAFYLFGVRNWQINERDTNRISWKKAHKFLNANFFNYMKHYDPTGAKKFKPPVYAMTKKIDSELYNIDEDVIQEYSLTLWLLFKIIQSFVKLRIADVSDRRYKYAIAKRERELALEAEKELKDRRTQFIAEEKQKHEIEMDNLPEDQEPHDFEEERLLAEFDDKDLNQPVDIPDEVFKEEDGDIDWEEPDLPPVA